jgi:hypothetical protein
MRIDVANVAAQTLGAAIGQEVGADIGNDIEKAWAARNPQAASSYSKAQQDSTDSQNPGRNRNSLYGSSGSSSTSTIAAAPSSSVSTSSPSLSSSISDGDMLTSLGVLTDDPTLAILGATNPDSQSMLSQLILNGASRLMTATQTGQTVRVSQAATTSTPLSLRQSVKIAFLDEMHETMTYVDPILDKTGSFFSGMADKFNGLADSSWTKATYYWNQAQAIDVDGFRTFADIDRYSMLSSLSAGYFGANANFEYLNVGSKALGTLGYLGTILDLQADYSDIKAASPGFDTYVTATKDIGGTIFGAVAGGYVGIRTDSILAGAGAGVLVGSFWKGSVDYVAQQIVDDESLSSSSYYQRSAY